MPSLPWRAAVRVAADMAPAPPIRVGLQSAIGAMLAQPVAALADLPPVPAAAAAGFAVRGVGPWTLLPDPSGLPGDLELYDGTALALREGDPLPRSADAVLPYARSVCEQTSAGTLVLVGDAASATADHRPGSIAVGSGIAAAGSDARAGQLLLSAGLPITAGTIALAASAGVDELTIVPPATVAPLLLGSDLLSTGPPRRGRNRDIVAPLLPSWVMGSGARCLPEQTGDESDLAAQIDRIGADLTVLTSAAGTGSGAAVTRALQDLRAEILIDALSTAPAADVLLAELPDGRRLLAVPREPAAAVVVLALLLTPMMRALSGRGTPRFATVMLREGIPAARHDRAVALHTESGELADLAIAHPWTGPAGLGALAEADAIGFVDAGRGTRGDSIPIVALPGAPQN